MALLDYENEIFLDCFHDDGLLIMAKGLAIERIFTTFLKLYSDEANLVLVLNVTQAEEEYFTELLEASGTKPLPKVINSSCSTSDRQSIYLKGGVLFITARILVVDLLVERVPIHLISGILVYRAHKVIESCQEAFILRLYRQKNKTGFIKAFSDNPQCFTSGFCQVERVMKSLFVRKLFLWPRFHASVVAFFDKHKIDVVELHLQMTDSMTACQTALLDLIDACIKELKRSNSVLDTEEINVEYAITKNFDRVLRMQLDPIWHQLSSKTKQLVNDLKTLRLILEYLTQYDCVNFYSLVNALKTSESTLGTNAGWLFMDSAENLFVHAKERLSMTSEPGKKKKRNEDSRDSSGLEECPKWAALKEVLEEIEVDCRSDDQEFGSVRILVVAHDDRTCNQLKSYLCEGGQPLLKRLYERNLAMKKLPLQQMDAAGSSVAKGKGQDKSRKKKASSKNTAELTLTQMIGPTEDLGPSTSSSTSGDFDAETNALFQVGSSCTAAYRVNDLPLTFLHPLREADDPNSLIRILHELRPRFVVLYDAEMAFVRQLEVFKACNPMHPVRVYFLMYTGSTEEQKYLTTLRKEKEAFEYLIKQKATMVIPEEREGRMENDPELERGATAANATVNTRQGGVSTAGANIPQKIIVDMREFRSELPSLIHRRGIDIEPVTLEVGDYILTKDICVERKSVSDLIGSLNNGRVYNQCLAMCRTYKRPVLLIEFDPNKPFTLQAKYPISGEINSNDTISRLVLLTIHFPRLRILWCPSPFATAELFEELKDAAGSSVAKGKGQDKSRKKKASAKNTAELTLTQMIGPTEDLDPTTSSSTSHDTRIQHFDESPIVGRDQPDVKDAVAVAVDLESEKNIGRYNPGPQDMLLKMPGITSKNVFAIMNHVKNIAELASLSLERLTELLASSIHAKQLYDLLHKELQGPVSTASGKPSNQTAKQNLKRLPLRKPLKKS